ncbi:MAG: DNA gyrase inhibitor YacG [Alphaproteobacteria bacterium]|nr:DNA gyrase inhibitor YacG [Alphaproteobacteria bacterium]MBR3912816.1 DNA gyrase inhibitor YacG [Alphaproteobacteria bacterium]
MQTEKKCPICGKPIDEKYKPFCSKHCADIDLGRWLKGNYVIHTNETPQDSENFLENEDNPHKNN